MVYYLISENVKMLRKINNDYAASQEVSPFEYMKSFIEKCPENAEDAKISWIAESFLGIQKHKLFLTEIATKMNEVLSDEDVDYFVIILHAVTFQIEPKDMQLFYKCLFNLSKPLLNTFTKYLSNNEVLKYIAQVAQNSYDTNYITEKIIAPLFIWQPYISDMAHNYALYIKKIENRKIKPPTVPIQPNVLNRKGKERKPTSTGVFPLTPPNSIRTKNKKMLTKNEIDEKLKSIHEKNKERATNMLNFVRTKNFRYAQVKSDRYYQRLSDIKDGVEVQYSTRSYPKPTNAATTKPAPVVKETAATLRRMNKRVQMAEEEEVEWLQTLMKTCRNTATIEEIEDRNRQELERQRLLDIEKKHLKGLISYEEAVLAKSRVKEENKKKYEEFLKEKELWNEEIEKWKKIEMEKNRRSSEKLSEIELNVLKAKQNAAVKKKENADKVKQETDFLIAKALKEKQEELEYRIKMIKEIKILSMIARKARVPKIIDLTETSGLGLLCEMSMAELQERLAAFKIGLSEELERKKKLIKEQNAAAKEDLENTKKSIKSYMADKETSRKQNTKTVIEPSTTKEINDLRKILVEKRKQRLLVKT
ncbi:cilia- and flagella-associated protein 99-like [Plodia interpunctella]|uniref:cilia- and flagella-associated protein 99-like n=1 Tax=Plodia interpunctella TaxID=58824 RepID=UPI00236794DC|nr:cilia- and flagella-associated protein 99-like [Plodia interpunctella]